MRDALHEHSVLFFHDQELTEDEQLAFASTFGPVGQYPLTKMFGGTAMSSTIEDTADSPPDADGWHTDVTWVAEPPAYAVLNAQVIPERGGDTMWASLFAAYDALSPVMQDLCCQLTVRHHSGADFHERVSRTMGEEVAERIMTAFPPVEHPLVRTHPVTGRRALFVSGRFMDQIVGMHRDESDALLGYPAAPHRGPELLRALALDARATSRCGTRRAPTTARSPTTIRRIASCDDAPSTATRPYFDSDQKGSD